MVFSGAISANSAVGILAAVVVLWSATTRNRLFDTETLSNVPQTLSGIVKFLGHGLRKLQVLQFVSSLVYQIEVEYMRINIGGDGKAARIQRPKSRKAETCTVKCVTTCIRGGSGSPGEGPLNARRYAFFSIAFHEQPVSVRVPQFLALESEL